MDNEHYYHQHTTGYIGYTAGGPFANPARVAQIVPKVASAHLARPHAGGRSTRAVTGLDAKEKNKSEKPPDKKPVPKKKGKDQKGKPKDNKNSQKSSKAPDEGADKGEQEQKANSGLPGSDIPLAYDLAMVGGGLLGAYAGSLIDFKPLTIAGIALMAGGAYLTYANLTAKATYVKNKVWNEPCEDMTDDGFDKLTNWQKFWLLTGNALNPLGQAACMAAYDHSAAHGTKDVKKQKRRINRV